MDVFLIPVWEKCTEVDLKYSFHLWAVPCRVTGRQKHMLCASECFLAHPRTGTTVKWLTYFLFWQLSRHPRSSISKIFAC